MTIWQASYHDSDEGHCLQWFATRMEAKKALMGIAAEYEAEGGDCLPMRVYKYELPATKAGFIHWLNVHFNRDNG